MDKLKDLLNTKDYSSSFLEEEKSKGKVACLIGYFFVLFFIPLLHKNNKYCKYHANQSLVLLVFSLSGGVLLKFLSLIFDTLSLNIISLILKVLFSIILIIYLSLGIMNVFQDKAQDLPIIGKCRLIK